MGDAEADPQPEPNAAAEETPKVFDAEPLIELATKMKEDANACMKRKDCAAAARTYGEAVTVLDRADGYPMLRTEVEAMIKLKAVLLSNQAQAYLSDELYSRAVTAASNCLLVDEANVKALHRRSLANEKLRRYDLAVNDAVALRNLGGGGLPADDLEKRIAALQGKLVKDEDESSEDEFGNELVTAKQRFDDIVEKYDLRDGNAAAELADWLTSGEWKVTVDRVAKRWGMEPEDAKSFLDWIEKGIEVKHMLNDQNA